jgi:hypothetical protein
MADSFLTLADLLKVNDKNLADINVSDVLNDAPIIRALAAEPVDGTTHKYLKLTTAPTVGFRDVNEGRDNSKSVDTPVTVDLGILDATFAVDVALADGYNKGPEAYIQREAERHLRAAFFKAETQLLYGTDDDADGFEGLMDSLAFGNAMVVDAGGDNDGEISTVFAVRSTGLNDVVLMAGKNAGLEIGETTVQRIVQDTGSYPGYYTPIYGWLGLQVGSIYSAGRIANLDTTDDLDDDLLAELYSKFPATAKPTHFIMSRRSQLQLQQSRTATNPTGAPAPFPQFWQDIPIITTDSVEDTGSPESAGS